MTKETRKSLLIMLVCVVTVPILLFKGCTSLGKTIYTSMDCDRFNIDHIEMRTGIDIQRVISDQTRLCRGRHVAVLLTAKRCSLTPKSA